MPLNFVPNYQITPKIANDLIKIEQIKERIKDCPSPLLCWQFA